MGGGEVSLLLLVSRLDRSRAHPSVVVFETGPLVERLEEKGIPVKVIPRPGGLRDITLLVSLIAWLRGQKIDLVHVNTLDIRAGVAARLAGCRLVGHLRVIFPFTWVDRLFGRLANRIIAVSNAAKEHYAGTRSLADRVVVVSNAAESPPAPKRNIRNELGLSDTTFLIGSVSRIDPVKGLEYLIAAMPEIIRACPSAHLLIVGAPGNLEGELIYSQDLKGLTSRENLDSSVTFTGYRKDAPTLISQLDVLVVPSLTLKLASGIQAEGFGRVAVEAMACGTPVVASRSGGLPDVIEHGKTGLLVPAEDASAIASTVITLISSPETRRSLAKHGSEAYTSRFTPERHVDNIERIYNQLCA